MSGHEPVLYEEVMAALAPRPGGMYVDGTINGGGHAAGVLERSAPQGRLLGVDLDREALEVARETLANYGSRVQLVHGSFGHLDEIARRHGFYPAAGVLLDLGISTAQLTARQRGFSFQLDGPLDMRLDPSEGITAADLVNSLPEAELADLLYEFGEERKSRRIARAIVKARPLRTTTELAKVVARSLRRRGRIHPATRTFLALRIAVNDELAVLSRGLKKAVDTLAPGGQLVVIAFHSLEDRIVKNYFRALARGEGDSSRPSVRLLTRKPIQPAAVERARNPASRSAKLRALVKLAESGEPTGAVTRQR